MRRALMLAFAAATAAGASAIVVAQTSADPVVTVETGALRGVVHDGVASYLGIPYAAPPVGNLRWRKPEPPRKWQGVRAADKFGNDCVQHRQYDQP
jgi:para-nitrobenzyl esterase